MNCHAIEPLLLAERDGVLTPEEHALLAEHLGTCPACRRSRLVYGEAVTFLKTDAANVAVPNIDEEWLAVRARMRAPSQPVKKPLAPVIWFGAPLAAAAALAITFFAARPHASVTPEDNAGASIAYVDQESGWLVVWSPDADGKTSG